jgi:hypothetical protein
MFTAVKTAENVAVNDLQCLGSSSDTGWNCWPNDPGEEAVCSQITGTGCVGHGRVFNRAHQLLLNPAFHKSHTSCNQWETTSSWNTAVVSNPAFWIFTMVYTSNISKIMHSAVCWVLVTSVQTLISTTLNRTPCFHSWLVCYLPSPSSLNWFGHSKFSLLNKQIWKMLCTSLHLVKPLLLVGAEWSTFRNQLNFCVWGVLAQSILDLVKVKNRLDVTKYVVFYCLNMFRAPICPSSGVQLVNIFCF